MEIYLLIAAQEHNSYEWIEEENRKIDEKIARARATAGWCIAQVRRLGAVLADRQGRAIRSTSEH